MADTSIAHNNNEDADVIKLNELLLEPSRSVSTAVATTYSKPNVKKCYVKIYTGLL